jgi:hypothetical protein
MDNLDNNDYQVEDVLYMSKHVCTREVPDLHWLCLKVIANSDIDNFALEREISGEALESVKRFRLELGHEEGCRLEQVQEMQCRAIHRQCFYLWWILPEFLDDGSLKSPLGTCWTELFYPWQ